QGFGSCDSPPHILRQPRRRKLGRASLNLRRRRLSRTGIAQAVSATHRSRASIIAFQFGTYVTIGAQPLSRENSPRFPYFSRRPLAYLTRRRAFFQRPGKASLTHILQEKDRELAK